MSDRPPEDIAREAWADLKRKINVQYYLGPNRMNALDTVINKVETVPEPEATPEPTVKEKLIAAAAARAA